MARKCRSQLEILLAGRSRKHREPRLGLIDFFNRATVTRAKQCTVMALQNLSIWKRTWFWGTAPICTGYCDCRWYYSTMSSMVRGFYTPWSIPYAFEETKHRKTHLASPQNLYLVVAWLTTNTTCDYLLDMANQTRKATTVRGSLLALCRHAVQHRSAYRVPAVTYWTKG